VVEQTQALAISIGIELTCLLGLGHVCGWTHKRDRWAWILAGIAATLVTHPFAWEFSITHTPTLTPEGKALRIEAAVVVAEALIYALVLRLRPGRAFALSLFANATSFGAGLLL
jgi:hypothetical protein